MPRCVRPVPCVRGRSLPDSVATPGTGLAVTCVLRRPRPVHTLCREPLCSQLLPASFILLMLKKPSILFCAVVQKVEWKKPLICAKSLPVARLRRPAWAASVLPAWALLVAVDAQAAEGSALQAECVPSPDTHGRLGRQPGDRPARPRAGNSGKTPPGFHFSQMHVASSTLSTLGDGFLNPTTCEPH